MEDEGSRMVQPKTIRVEYTPGRTKFCAPELMQ